MTCTNEKGNEYFDIKKLHECFQLSLVEEDDIDINYYLEAYKELNKFCNLLGSVFSFVRQEVISKSKVMHELRNNCNDNHFDTLKNMINHEKESQLLTKEKYVSGCRTLLRLHRGLDFIRTFLRQVAELELHENTSHVCVTAYSNTLGMHHPWYIRQGAYVAMKFLPTKEKLLNSVCGTDFEEIAEILPPMLEAADEVYNRTQSCYETHDLLDLP